MPMRRCVACGYPADNYDDLPWETPLCSWCRERRKAEKPAEENTVAKPPEKPWQWPEWKGEGKS